MLLLIDGYNVIAPVAPPRRDAANQWLRAARDRLVRQLADSLPPEIAAQTVIVFDAASAPVGAEPTFMHLRIRVEFAVAYDQADDRIEELIQAHSSPKRLTVVSSDHRIQAAALRRGALAIDSEAWLDSLERKQPILAVAIPGEDDSRVDPSDEKPEGTGDVAQWMAEFGLDDPSPRPAADTYNPFPDGYGEDLLG